jgi:signal transduction histidine kinase
MQKTIGTFEIVIGGSILIFVISVLFVIPYYHFSRKMIINKLQQNNMMIEHQKSLLQNEVRIVEKERKRIARDLHDEIGANLAYIGMNLDQVIKECPHHEKQNETLLTCKKQLNKTIDDVRRISHDLLPPVLEMFGLPLSVQEYLDKLDSSFRIDYRFDESISSLNPETSLQLYRVILELINNSIKHSHGDTIHLKMEDHGETIEIALSDNGIGYQKEMIFKNDGLGMKNIMVRLESIGASYSIGSGTHKGFFIRIVLNKDV